MKLYVENSRLRGVRSQKRQGVMKAAAVLLGVVVLLTAFDAAAQGVRAQGKSPSQNAGVVRSVPKHSSAGSSATGRRIFAPYIHIALAKDGLAEIRTASGIRTFVLAFIVSGGGCSAAWQSTEPVPIASETFYAQQIDRLRGSGGDVIVSFGGYAGRELAFACPNAASLAAAYQTVVDKYKVRALDFDIETGAESDAATIERRSEALVRLVRANPKLDISFTVPAVATGIPQEALEILKSAQKHRVPISVVNLMAMDYGQPIPDGEMGARAIATAESAALQLRTLGIRAGIGITAMIGMNDTPGETFTLDDARKLVTYAKSNSVVRRLSIWSVGRDHGGCVGTVSPACSGIAQGDWEFTRIFRQF
jgi:hypothetical protein